MDHPAKFSDTVIDGLSIVVAMEQERLGRELIVLDPFSGVGLVHKVGSADVRTFGNEIEFEWASQTPNTVVGDAMELPFADETVDVGLTSPTYGNRMADHHDAKDGSVRHTYKHTLGRDLHPNNSGGMQWGHAYRLLHAKAWMEMERVIKPGGLMVLNISNHIRKGEEVKVAEWHLESFLHAGWGFEGAFKIGTKRQKHGANRDLRVANEWIFKFRKDL